MSRNARWYFTEGESILKQATQFDRQSNYPMAIKFYSDAMVQFQLAKQQSVQPDMPLPAQADQIIQKCSARLAYLQSNPTPNPNPTPRHPSTAPTPPSPPSSGQPSDPSSDPLRSRIESAIIVEQPSVKFADVAGLDAAKRSLDEAVFMPLRYPQLFTGERTPWRGILLYGPPGTGKTFLAKAIAGESQKFCFITVSTADLLSKWVGESQKLIRSLFEVARSRAPAIIFIDEIDSLLSQRKEDDSDASSQVKAEFLIQMDGLGNSMNGILLLAATNLPWVLDQAVRRRFEKRIYIPLPDFEARLALITMKMSSTPHSISPEQFGAIAERTEGFSGADLKNLTREASFVAVRSLRQAKYFCKWDGKLWACNPDQEGAFASRLEDLEDPSLVAPPPVLEEHFATALATVRPSVAPGDLGRYVKWTNDFGMEGN
jgi:vacuolar protein-sorting-associated protein 4